MKGKTKTVLPARATERITTRRAQAFILNKKILFLYEWMGRRIREERPEAHFAPSVLLERFYSNTATCN